MALPITGAAVSISSSVCGKGKSDIGSLAYFSDNDECVENERQISVDPISLRESSSREDMIVQAISTPDVADLHLPPPLPPTQFKFLSYSLPNSNNSSPRFGEGVASMKKRGKNENRESQLKVCYSTRHRQQSAVQDEDELNALQEDAHFRRSKSCGEGRTSAPADDLDLWLNKPDVVQIETNNSGSSFRTQSNKEIRNSIKKIDPSDDDFKCGALCLFLPGFSKGRVIKSIIKEEPEVEPVLSRTVSLEKFECGSWASSGMANDTGDDGDSASLFFDLPLELIRKSVDTNTPVSAAFVFDRDRKGILKNGSTKTTGKLHEPSHYIRFSTSTPSGSSSPSSCITPRLRKAREEFNAFLEAQSSA